MGLPGCLFYDANILFTLLEGWLQQALTGNIAPSSFFVNAERVHLEAKRIGVPCLASHQSYSALEDRVKRVNDFAADTLRSFVQFLRQEKTVSGQLSPFDSNEDIFLVERFIVEQFRPLGQSKNWEKESLRLLERLIFDAILRATGKRGSTTSTQSVIDQILGTLVDLTRISDGRQTCLVRLQSEVKAPTVFGDPQLFREIKNNVLIGDDEDVGQLSVAIQHQKTANIWTVFVTTDYAHVISVAGDILSKFKLQCSAPLYAIAYLERLSAKGGPVPDPKQYIR